MTSYIAIYGALAFAGTLRPTRLPATTVLVMCLVFLALFVGGRYETGCDFSQYLFRFEQVKGALSGSSLHLAEDLGFFLSEQGFLALNLAVIYLGLDYIWLNIFAASIFCTCVAVFARRFDDPVLILAIYFPVLVVQLSMGIVRQSIAVGLLMLAFAAFMDGKRVRVALWVLAAYLFHNSAIAFIPLAYLAGRKVSYRRVAAGVALLAPVGLYLMSDRLDIYAARYVDDVYGEKEALGGLLRLALLLIAASFFFLFRDQFERKMPREYDLFRIFSVLTIALVPVVLLSSSIVHRIGYYLMPVQLLILASVPSVVFVKSQARLASLLPVSIIGCYFLGWLVLSTHARECWLPYESAFFR